MRTKRDYSPGEIRREFESAIEGRSLTSVAEEVGVPLQTVSVTKHGYTVGGKLLKWLGFERVTVYRRIPRKGARK